VVSLCRLKQCFSLHKDTTPPQSNHTVTPTHIEPEQYNTWNKSTISRKLLKMDVLTFETCWAVNSEIIKQVTSTGLSLFNYQDDARSNKLKIIVICLRIIVLIFGEFHENRRREGCTYFTAVSEIQFTCVPLNGSMTFWNYETPEYNLQTASNLQPFCDYRNGNTTKPHPNFRIKRFTVYCGFHLLLEVNDNFVPLYSWQQRAGVRIMVDMETCPWELSVKWQHEYETCCVCVWLQLMVPRLFLNYMRTSRALSSRKLMNS